MPGARIQSQIPHNPSLHHSLWLCPRPTLLPKLLARIPTPLPSETGLPKVISNVHVAKSTLFTRHLQSIFESQALCPQCSALIPPGAQQHWVLGSCWSSLKPTSPKLFSLVPALPPWYPAGGPFPPSLPWTFSVEVTSCLPTHHSSHFL